MATRSELVEAIVERYRSGSRSDKRLILDEFVAVTGYHRKHATECSVNASKIPGNKRHSLRYGGDVREALVVFVGGIGAAVFQTAAAVDTCLAASA